VSSKRKQGSGRRARGPAITPRPIAVGVLPNLIGYNIRRAQIALWRDLTRTVGHREIRPAVFSLLILVESNPGIAQIELAEQLDIDEAAIVGLIHRLQRNDWVVRRRSQEDRRRQGIFLTSRGQDFLNKFRGQMLEHERRFTRLFTREELAQLFAYLRRIHP
jgi:DNA-binding MarR family transcriptional regulator